MRTELPYGRQPLPVSLPANAVWVEPPEAPDAPALAPMLRAALDAPIGAPRLEALARPGARVVLIVSDVTRDEPRDAMAQAVLERLPDDAVVTLAIANGTHGPCGLERLGLSDAVRSRATAVVDHDARDARGLMLLGTTARGTPLRVHRCLADADLVVATGRIKPHYFAGYGAGAKALFPGLGANDDVRRNHELKRARHSRAGEVERNPCRLDLEEIADVLPGSGFLLNVVTDAAGGVQSAVAGELRLAFRRGVALSAPWFEAVAPAADCIVVSDRGPVTGSLYQASKLVAAVARHLRPGGRIVLAAECWDGVGPVDTVNRGIYELGLRPRLPPGHQIDLVSSLDRATVAATYCSWSPTVEAAVFGAPLVVPHAGVMLLR